MAHIAFFSPSAAGHIHPAPGMLAEASVATLRKTIREVVADRSIKENLVPSRRELKDAGGTGRAVGVFEKVLAEEAGRS